MSLFLDKVKETCKAFPDIPAFTNSAHEQLSYSQLDTRSDALASHLIGYFSAPGRSSCASIPADPSPNLKIHGQHESPIEKVVAFRGHKQPDMITVMIACMKAGVCYVPLDSSLPTERVNNILSQLGNALLIEVEPGSCEGLNSTQLISAEELETICTSKTPAPDPSFAVKDEDPHYILFTSGSTGDPKGVVQPARSMDHTFRYFERFIPKNSDEHLVMFNRAHFSFDLSLFDLVIALPFGHTMFALDAETEDSLARTFSALKEANPALWVSTPSFLNLCLADPSFDQDLLPSLRSVVVCGETLFKSTAEGVLDRFPSADLFNTYGPTEAQGAITDVQVTRALLETYDVLPVGTCSPYNELQIVDPETKALRSTGETGEICILGATIATGYFGREDLTKASFATRLGSDRREHPAYFTGDNGHLDEQKMLWFEGRFDNQVKVNGFRIELQEIEIALNSIDEVVESCVTVVDKDVLSSYLVAHLSVKDTGEKQRIITKRLKEQLKQTLPHYMIPRVFKYYDEMPKSINGKIDRKKLMS